MLCLYIYLLKYNNEHPRISSSCLLPNQGTSHTHLMTLSDLTHQKSLLSSLDFFTTEEHQLSFTKFLPVSVTCLVTPHTPLFTLAKRHYRFTREEPKAHRGCSRHRANQELVRLLKSGLCALYNFYY